MSDLTPSPQLLIETPIRTMTAAQWKSAKAPDFHKKPAVFLLLAQ